MREDAQKRRSPRSNLLMAASLEYAGAMIAVRLRNLSADGALVEGDHGLSPGAEIVFHKNDLAVAGRVAWVAERRAGIAFAASLEPETVLRHVPAPKALQEEAYKKRPGFRGTMSAAERRLAEDLWGQPFPFTER